MNRRSLLKLVGMLPFAGLLGARPARGGSPMIARQQRVPLAELYDKKYGFDPARVQALAHSTGWLVWIDVADYGEVELRV